MTEREAKVLIREIGKLAGFMGGFGARYAAKRLPVEESENSLVIPGPAGEVRASVSLVLQSVGTITDEFASEGANDTMSAIVGSGHMNLNPTIAHVRIIESSDTSTTLSLRALAKEGLIKQHSAKRAIERIGGLISARFAAHTPGADSPLRDLSS